MALQSNISPLFVQSDLFKIKSTYPLPSSLPVYYLQVVEEIVENAIPRPIRDEILRNANPLDIASIFYRLTKSLPIIHCDPFSVNCLVIPITCIIPAEYTDGAGRYISDTLSRWLVPGKTIYIIGGVSLNFQFSAYPATPFFVQQNIIQLTHPSDLQVIQSSFYPLIEELKINIMAVYHARYIASLRSASPHHRKMIFEENISSILNQKEDADRNIYDQMQLFFTKTNTEEKIDEIKKNISNLFATRPKIFDRDVFYEMNYHSTFFKTFSSMRDTRHLSRVIAYQYLFKKVISERTQRSPTERHFSFKILRTSLNGSVPVIAILCCLNFLKDTERFDVKHLMEAIKSCLAQPRFLLDSIIVDRRHENIRSFYLEFTREGFTHEEMKSLKARLPQEILRQIENVVHPIFMPRNDEELMRNLVVLNNQIKYKRDLPQVSIHYDMQSESNLTFTVILVRLLFKSSSSISKLIHDVSSSTKFMIEDVRISGYLKSKYPKESAILKISLDKSSFFRPDYSVDLLRARQKIAIELRKLIGEFRDFNGGIILKQDEALTQLRTSLEPLPPEKELLLENYFYSLRPGIMQTIYEPATLKFHFELLLKAIDFPLSSVTHQMLTLQDGKYFLCFIKAIAPSFKEPLFSAIADLQIPSHDLTTTSLQVDQAALMGMILRMEDQRDLSLFIETSNRALTQWSEEFACSLTSFSPEREWSFLHR